MISGKRLCPHIQLYILKCGQIFSCHCDTKFLSAKVDLNFDGIIIITWMFIKLIFYRYINKSSFFVALAVSHKLMIIHLYSYTTI